MAICRRDATSLEEHERALTRRDSVDGSGDVDVTVRWLFWVWIWFGLFVLGCEGKGGMEGKGKDED